MTRALTVFAITCVVLLSACSPRDEPHEAAMAPMIKPPLPPPPPSKPMKMICRNSQTGAAAVCGTPMR